MLGLIAFVVITVILIRMVRLLTEIEGNLYKIAKHLERMNKK